MIRTHLILLAMGYEPKTLAEDLEISVTRAVRVLTGDIRFSEIKKISEITHMPFDLLIDGRVPRIPDADTNNITNKSTANDMSIYTSIRND